MHLDIHFVAAIKAAETISIGFRNVFYEINRLIQNPTMEVNGILYDLEF